MISLAIQGVMLWQILLVNILIIWIKPIFRIIVLVSSIKHFPETIPTLGIWANLRGDFRILIMFLKHWYWYNHEFIVSKALSDRWSTSRTISSRWPVNRRVSYLLHWTSKLSSKRTWHESSSAELTTHYLWSPRLLSLEQWCCNGCLSLATRQPIGRCVSLATHIDSQVETSWQSRAQIWLKSIGQVNLQELLPHFGSRAVQTSPN